MWLTAERIFVGHVCFPESIPVIPFGIPSIQSLREGWGSWVQQHAPTALHYGCITILPTPLLLKAQSRQLFIGLQQSDSTTESTITAFVANLGGHKSVTKPSAYLYETGVSCNCNEGMGSRKEICSRNPFLQLLSGISIIHSLPEAGSWVQQHAPPPLHCGCIMPIPSLQLQEKTRLMQRSRGFGHGVVVSKICYNAVPRASTSEHNASPANQSFRRHGL